MLDVPEVPKVVRDCHGIRVVEELGDVGRIFTASATAKHEAAAHGAYNGACDDVHWGDRHGPLRPSWHRGARGHHGPLGGPRGREPHRAGAVDVHWKVTQMVIGQRAPWSSGIEQIGRGMAVPQASGARPELCFPSGRGLWQEPPGRRKGA